MFFEISVIQAFSTVNLNRDDANAIKTINFGGYRRQRVSSQCWKRAIRSSDEFLADFKEDMGIRTRKVLTEICRIAQVSPGDEKVNKGIIEFLEKIGMGKSEPLKKKSKGKSNKDVDDENESSESEGQRLVTLFFASPLEIEIAARILKKHDFDPAKSSSEFGKEREKLTLSPDIALFGRMAASNPKLKVDSAVQFAHAISTNEIQIEDDFFTGLDDLISASEKNEEATAAMLGNVQLASPCFYRYACVSYETLVKNLGGDKELALKSLNAFFRAFIKAVPSGKNTSTAPASVPDLVLVSATRRQPVSLANAFIRPIDIHYNSKLSLVESSANSLASYLGKLNNVYNWKEDRKSLCIHLLDPEMEFEARIKGLNIETKTENIDKNLELFIKEIAWS